MTTEQGGFISKNSYRGPDKNWVLLRRSPISIPDHAAYTGSMQEELVDRELEALQADIEQVVGATAIEVALEMRLHDPVPKGASEDELRQRKDLLDNIAAGAMSTSLDSLDRTIHIIEGEGTKDIIENGQEIDIVEGMFGKGGQESEGVNDALELTTAAARAEKESSSAIAITEPGGFLRRPNNIHRMTKLIAPLVEDFSLSDSPRVTFKRALNGLALDDPKKLRVTVLRRPQNAEIIRAAEELDLDLDVVEGGDLLPGAMVGDWKMGEYGHIVYTIGGGWPEGMFAAAAAKARGNVFFEARPFSKDPKVQAENDQILTLQDLVPGDPHKTFATLAHVTDDPMYAHQPGVSFYHTQVGETAIVAVTTIDSKGIRKSNIVRSLN